MTLFSSSWTLALHQLRRMDPHRHAQPRHLYHCLGPFSAYRSALWVHWLKVPWASQPLTFLRQATISTLPPVPMAKPTWARQEKARHQLYSRTVQERMTISRLGPRNGCEEDCKSDKLQRRRISKVTSVMCGALASSPAVKVRLTARKTAVSWSSSLTLSMYALPVLLTTSSDCTARVFGIDGSNPRTLTGHRRAVLGSAFIDRGKQVLTASADGTTRLWDVSKGIQVTSFPSQNYSSVNTVTLGSGSGEAAGSASSKLLVTGLSNGTLEAHDTDSRSVVFRLPRSRFPSGPAPQASDSWEQVWSGGVDALDWSRGGNVLLAGCSNGVTMLHDVRMLSSSTSSDLSADDTSRSVLYSWRRNGAAINDAQLLNAGKEAIMATADGTPYRVDLSSDVPRVVEEYTGWDVDNVQRACWVEGRSRVWLAGADGMARMY